MREVRFYVTALVRFSRVRIGTRARDLKGFIVSCKVRSASGLPSRTRTLSVNEVRTILTFVKKDLVCISSKFMLNTQMWTAPVEMP